MLSLVLNGTRERKSMTKKSSGSSKPLVKIKATKGAWWNFKVEPEDQEASSTLQQKEKKSRKTKQPEQQETVAENAPVVSEKAPPERKPQVRKPHKKGPVKLVTPKDDSVDKSSVPEKVEEKDLKDQKDEQVKTAKSVAEDTPAEKKAAKPKKQPRRSGRKPKTPADKKAVAADQASEEEKTDLEPDAKSEKQGQDNGSLQESTPPAKGRRGRKRGRKSKKSDTSQAVETDAASNDTESVEEETSQIEEKPKAIRLLINAEEPEECRLALLEDGRLESIHVSTVNRAQTKSNIYKAKIVAIEPSLQAAFVDYGTSKNGFLPFSEIHPEYYKDDLDENVRKQLEAGQWKRLKIEDVVEHGQEMLVQVVKEEVGKKGANMTTFLSLPGRCVVLMPGSDSTGISRKISGESRRSQLRDIMYSLEIPEGIGWIVRTASSDITETALSRDVQYLLKLWEDIRSKGQALEDVGLIYEDHRSVMRFLREHFDPSIQEILVDDRGALEQVQEFIGRLPSEQQNVNVRMHRGSRPIFNQFSVEDQIESIYQPQVNLPSGGSIVINPTEALVAIDVNSGSTSKGQSFEESIFQANMEAAAELARQLRLRDLGGLVVVDFIDMRNKKHIRDVEKQVKLSMKRDKAKVDFSRISKFGLMQISRQKLGSPIEVGNYRVCQHCKGRGTVKSVETLALFYLRRIQTGASRNPVVKIECHFPMDVASYLLNNKRREIYEFENKYKVEILIIADSSLKPAENEIIFHKQEKEQDVKK